MIDQAKCAECDSFVPPFGIYCPHCLKQARCGECRELLLPNAIGCVHCGTRAGTSSVISSQRQQSAEPLVTSNTFLIDESLEHRRVEARFSDNAVAGLSDLLATILTVKRLQDRSPASRAEEIIEDVEVLEVVQEPETTTDNGSPQLSERANPIHTRIAPIAEVFITVDEGIVLDNPYLKGTSNQDYYRRLFVLFLHYMREIEGVSQVSREDLKSLMERAGWYSTNAYKVLNEGELFDLSGDNVRLRAPGRKVAERYLADVADDSIEGAALPNSQKTNRPSKRNEEGDGSRSLPSRGQASPIHDELQIWDSLGLVLKKPSTDASFSSVDKAVIGLWAYSKTQSAQDVVVGREKIASFLRAGLSIDIDGRTVARAFETVEGRAMVTHVKKRGYKLRPAGQEKGTNFFHKRGERES